MSVFLPDDPGGEDSSPTPEASRAIGARIESVRFRLDRTQREFARLLGVTAKAVRAWERGEEINRDDLLQIAETTDTSIEWLIEGARQGGEPCAARSPERPIRSAGRRAVEAECIKPKSIVTDGPPPREIASAWNAWPEPMIASTAGAESGVVRGRPSALLLSFPGGSILLGKRATAYRCSAGAPNAPAEFMLNLALNGRSRLTQRGLVCEGDAGREGGAAFTSSAEASFAEFDPKGRYLSVFLPTRALLEPAPLAETHVMESIAPDSPTLRLLAAYVSALMKSKRVLDREAAGSVADHLVDLCALLLGAEGDEKALAEARGVAAARISVVLESIEAGAARPGFSARSVARRLGLTERQVHDLLWQAGKSYSDRVNERRLEIAERRLADPRFDKLSIDEVAFLAGFMDLATFTRLFRERFGDWPKACRSAVKASRRRGRTFTP